MSVEVSIVEGPLPFTARSLHDGDGVDALLFFEEIVRPLEHERELAALCYEEYPPMWKEEAARV